MKPQVIIIIVIVFVAVLIPVIIITSKKSKKDCTDGKTSCNKVCVNTDTDPSNCGMCNHACQQNEDCQNGKCVTTQTCGLCTPQTYLNRCLCTVPNYFQNCNISWDDPRAINLIKSRISTNYILAVPTDTGIMSFECDNGLYNFNSVVIAIKNMYSSIEPLNTFLNNARKEGTNEWNAIYTQIQNDPQWTNLSCLWDSSLPIPSNVCN